ncbi:uncharacterized protein L201_005707 [Kwoniella dendrophila CBS 6074]|uniref:Uncharacterized protein n=1 Tax=Kwoniella dendrophila CBS 6074 TaxID=1295534 RepID=A0AAX4K1X5_9TREE
MPPRRQLARRVAVSATSSRRGSTKDTSIDPMNSATPAKFETNQPNNHACNGRIILNLRSTNSSTSITPNNKTSSEDQSYIEMLQNHTKVLEQKIDSSMMEKTNYEKDKEIAKLKNELKISDNNNKMLIEKFHREERSLKEEYKAKFESMEKELMKLRNKLIDNSVNQCEFQFLQDKYFEMNRDLQKYRNAFEKGLSHKGPSEASFKEEDELRGVEKDGVKSSTADNGKRTFTDINSNSNTNHINDQIKKVKI